MKTLVSFVIRTLRSLFYNTPIKNWRLTEFLYARIGRLIIGTDSFPIIDFYGMKLKTDGGDRIVTTALLNGNYEPVTIDLFKKLIWDSSEAGRGFVADVGANIGAFTLVAAKAHPQSQVVAFEPNPISYRLLNENIEMNHLPNVFTVSSAVGDRLGSVSLDISSESAGMHSIYGTGARRIEVPLISLDHYFEKNPSLGMIKIDVEGFEPVVLAGMRRILERSDLTMIIEFNPEHLKRGDKIPSEFLDELSSIFDHLFSIDEIQKRPLPLTANQAALRKRLLTVGSNLILIKGSIPACLAN